MIRSNRESAAAEAAAIHESDRTGKARRRKLPPYMKDQMR